MSLLRTCALLMTLLVCCMGDFSFSPDDLQKELGYFGECNGKKINYPTQSITEGFSHVPVCTATVGLRGGQLNKQCVALCVAENMNIVDKDSRMYNYDIAVKPLYDSVESTDPAVKNDKGAIDIQAAALKRCGAGHKFQMKDDCPESKAFDECIRKAAVTDCGAKA